MQENQNKVLITAPVGSFASLSAAIDAKTDSIYFGIDKLNMRKRSSKSFTLDDVDTIARKCRENNILFNVTLNSIIYDDEIDLMHKICDELKAKEVSSIIAHDLSVITYARKIGLNVHISTQANVSNIESVKFFSKFADVIVLARELSIDKIKNICQEIKRQKILGPSGELVKIEIFIHGAMCIAISGKCYMSLAQYNFSANRGECLQACRRKYMVKEVETGKELEIDNNYIMSPKDLCTLPYLDEILLSGVSILKIEGRARTADYVKIVCQTYKDAIDKINKNTFTKEFIKSSIENLKKVYNRGFWYGGYYLDKELSENIYTKDYGSIATEKKIYIGKITNFYKKTNIAEIQIEANILKKNDNLLVIGNTTGAVYLNNIAFENHSTKNSNIAKNKELITIKLSNILKKNDKVYLLEKTK
jgi:U32 family peptidase